MNFLYEQYSDLEIWKEHPVYVNYEVSTQGNVRRCNGYNSLGRRVKIRQLKPWIRKHRESHRNTTIQYRTVSLWANGKKKTRPIGVFAAETFLGSRPEGYQLLHGAGGSLDDSLPNLRWGTASENQRDRVRDRTSNRGEQCGSSVLTAADVHAIRKQLQSGRKQRCIAKEFGVTRETISCINCKKSWSWLDEIN